MHRGSWDDYFMGLAFEVAQRSTCIGQAVGAIIVQDKKILATGYNGAPSGSPHCTDQGYCYKHDGKTILICSKTSYPSRAIHVEINAIAQSQANLSDAILYTTHEPCLNCLKAIIAAGIKIIYFAEASKGKCPVKDQFLKENLVVMHQI